MPEKILSNVDAVVAGAAVAAFYAVPDFLESRKVRAVAKGAVMAAIGSYFFSTQEVGAELAEVEEELSAEVKDNPALVAGIGAALAALQVASEKLIYRFGEHLKDSGVRAPHTKTALALGALCTISVVATNSLEAAK